jgi:hypothetical protein
MATLHVRIHVSTLHHRLSASMVAYQELVRNHLQDAYDANPNVAKAEVARTARWADTSRYSWLLHSSVVMQLASAMAANLMWKI